MNGRYRVGDKVVYIRQKFTLNPGPRAMNVYATPNGDGYDYHVEKYWLVSELLNNGMLVLRTRRGKQHVLAADDPLLRKATWFERLFKTHLFPQLPPAQTLLPN